MNQQIDETKTCVTGKIMHKSLLAANYQFDQMMRDNTVNNKHTLNVYYCHLCESFHVGNMKEGDE